MGELVNTGLVVRYFFDEAESGSSPTAVVDQSGVSPQEDLNDVNYGAGNLAWTKLLGNRGLESIATTGTQRARRTIHDTSDKVRDTLAGVQKLTFEIVVRVDVASASHSRIFCINNRSGANMRCGLKVIPGTPNLWRCDWNETQNLEFGQTLGTRHVIHIVYDTTLATATDRIKAYVDNVAKTMSTGGTAPTQNSTLSLPTGLDLTTLNRENAGAFDRSFDGILWYAAIYTGAMSDTDRAKNYSILKVEDDDDTLLAGTFAEDNFTRTVAANSPTWGTASLGGDWRKAAGSDHLQVDGAIGLIARDTNVRYAQVLDVGLNKNCDGKVRTSFSARPSAGWVYSQLAFRYGSDDDYYRFSFALHANGDIAFHVGKTVAGVITTLAAAADNIIANNYVADTYYWLRSKIEGTNLSLKIWQDGSAEPGTWTWTGSDTSIDYGNQVGLVSTISPTDSATVTQRFDDLVVADTLAAEKQTSYYSRRQRVAR